MLQTAGLTTGFTEAKKYKEIKSTFGYLARFDNSKQTQIIDLAAQLPNSFTLVVAGFNAGARDFTSKFIAISDNKPNIFLGSLEQKAQINFFHEIDVLVSHKPRRFTHDPR